MKTALSFLIILLSFSAFASNSGVTYQGRILKPDGSPLAGQFTQFKMQIRTPDSGSCLMYEEIQSQDLRNSDGVFSLTINDGNGSRTDGTGLTLDRIFANRGSFTLNPASCNAGSGVFAPGQNDGRDLVVLFKDETMSTWEPIPAQKINFVPLAFEAKQVAGFTADSLLRVVNGSGDPLTGLAPLSNAQYTELMALLNGTSNAFTKANQLAGIALPTMSTGEVLGWNGSAWVSQPAIAGSNSVTTAMIQNNAVDSTKIAAGAVSTTQIANNVSINTSGTVASAITTTRDFKIFAASPSAFSITMQAPALAASYSLVWPMTDGNSGEVLTTDGSGVLTWAPAAPASQWTTQAPGINYMSGRVGIGTTSPSRLFDVAGDVSINGMRVGLGSGQVASNVAIGVGALNSNTTGTSNIAIGTDAMNTSTVSYGKIAIGSYALSNGGDRSIAIGVYAGSGATGQDNIYIGDSTGYNGGNHDTMIGSRAANSVSYSGADNTLVGMSTGSALTTGSQNVLLGKEAGNLLTTGSNNILIGRGVQANSPTSSNALNIGNTIYGDTATAKVGIGTSVPANKLDVVGGATIGYSGTVTAPTNGLLVGGRLGVGDTYFSNGSPSVPQADLHVSNASGTSTFIMGRASSWEMKMQTNSGGFLTVDGGNNAFGELHKVQNGGYAVDLRLPASVFDIKSNGATALRMNYAGDVGIGTTSPTAKLDVSGTINATGFTLNGSPLAFGGASQTAPSGFTFNSNSDNTGSDGGFSFQNGGTNLVTITNAGNVGIGTSSPTGALHVVGGTSVSGQQTAPITLKGQDSGGGAVIGGRIELIPGAGTGGQPGGNVNVSLDAGGVFAITKQRYAPYTANSGSMPSEHMMLESGWSYDYQSSLIKWHLKNQTVVDKIAWMGAIADPSGSSEPTFIYAAGSGTERFRIAPGGNVGIGTTSPAALLDVNGTAKVATSVNVPVITSDSAVPMVIRPGTRTTSTGTGANLTVQAGIGSSFPAQGGAGTGGDLLLYGGNAGSGGNQYGGTVWIQAGNAGGRPGTDVTVKGGYGDVGNGGTVNILGGDPTNGTGGGINIAAMNGNGTNQNGGNVSITAGAPTGTGSAGIIKMMGGNVGIGTSVPTTKLDVQGIIRSVGNGGTTFSNSGSSVDWSNGNNQIMTGACTSTAFTNMADGATYNLLVTDTTATTCVFSQAGLTFTYAPANAARESGKMSLYSFTRFANYVVVGWTPLN